MALCHLNVCARPIAWRRFNSAGSTGENALPDKVADGQG